MPANERYPTIAVTADAVAIHVPDDPDAVPSVLLIRRARDPFAGCWAIPGGFVDAGEAPADAARRELEEETGVIAPKSRLLQIGAFGEPGRDPRGPTVSIVYVHVMLGGRRPRAVAADDASEIAWRILPKPNRAARGLAFDHAKILRETARQLRELIETPERFVERLLPRRPSPLGAWLGLVAHLHPDVIDRTVWARRLRAAGVPITGP